MSGSILETVYKIGPKLPENVNTKSYVLFRAIFDDLE